MKSSVLALALALGSLLGSALWPRVPTRRRRLIGHAAANGASAVAGDGERRASRLQRQHQSELNIPTTGIYDEEDRYTGPTGTPLPGWGSGQRRGCWRQWRLKTEIERERGGARDERRLAFSASLNLHFGRVRR